MPTALITSPLQPLHDELRARCVDFAGYLMPLNFPAGTLAECNACRQQAALFDISHMGQLHLKGPQAEAILARLTPSNLDNIGSHDLRYSLLLNAQGGIEDDIIISRAADNDGFLLVVNAARRAADMASIAAACDDSSHIIWHRERALLALQGPAAAAVLAAHCDIDLQSLSFMQQRLAVRIAGIPCHLARCGYTGEDGFELSCAAAQATALASSLLADERVQMAGLAARDMLRLEAGLCLYGQDIDHHTSPLEAGLGFAVSRRRDDFLGAERILRERAQGAPRKLVGIRFSGRRPVRHGAPLYRHDKAIGHISSGGYSATAGVIALALLDRQQAQIEQPVEVQQGRARSTGTICKLPFVPHRYHR